MAICLLLSSTSCIFGRSRGPRVLGYRHGVVHLTAKRSFQIGELPESWRVDARRGPSLIFRHQASGALLTVSSWCGPTFEDLPLPNLLSQLFQGIPLRQTLESSSFVLDGREARRERALREVDGVPVYCDAVVIKKNGCSFDFLLTAPAGREAMARGDFENAFRGFHYW